MLKSVIDLLAGNAVLVGLLVGAITPAVTSVIQQPSWSKNVRIGVAGAVSVLVGFALAAADGQLNSPGDLASIITAVLVSAEAFYQKVWKASGLSWKIEKATSRGAVSGDDFEAYVDPFYYDDYDYGDEPKDLETK